MKNTFLQILSLAVCLMAAGCYDDQSTGADRAIDRIEITMSKTSDTLSYFLGDNIVLEPAFVSKGSAVRYQWSIGEYGEDYSTKEINTKLKEISTQAKLEYTPNKLGHYYLRLIATNDHGSSVRYWHIFVNAEYEEGYMILSRDDDGVGNLSFMRILTAEEIAEGKVQQFKQHAFSYTNPGLKLDEEPVEIDKINTSLYIFCRKSNKILRIHAKTFQLEYTYDLNLLAGGLTPLTMWSYDSKFCSEILLPCSSGGVVRLAIKDLEVFWSKEYNQTAHYVSAFDRYNESSSKVLFARDDAGNFYMKGFNPANMGFENLKFDIFKNVQIRAQFADASGCPISIYDEAGTVKVIKIGSYGYSFSTKKIDTVYRRELTQNTTLLTRQSKLHVNDKYNCIFFNDGNKIYRWYYNQNEIPADALITLPAGEQIVQITARPYETENEEELFVLTDNPSRGALSGSLYVYSTVDGKLIKAYEGVANHPISVSYKIK